MSAIACIVLPTYNEAANLALLLPRIFNQQERIATHELHVLVVDDNSPDGSAAVVEEHRKRFPRLHLLRGERQGLGCAYQRGMAHALETLRPALIFEMDADLQHDPDLLPRFIERTREGYTVQIGSRFVAGGATPDFPWHRRLLSRAGNWLARWAAGWHRSATSPRATAALTPPYSPAATCTIWPRAAMRSRRPCFRSWSITAPVSSKSPSCFPTVSTVGRSFRAGITLSFS